MQIGVPRERLAGETRVAASPSSVEQLIKLGFEVCIESKAGALASFDDAAYSAAGAQIVSSQEIWACPLILKVNAPSEEEMAFLQEGTTLISFIWPAQNPALMEKLASKKINVLAMDAVPRISRAQALDALSSMAN
ncbi:Re/Si-specific NAD(P)(+) transhydrogenase subunit alpha, partial [Vibrio metoecus]